MLDAEAVKELRDYKAEVETHGSRDTAFHVSAKGATALKFPKRETLKVFSLTQLVNAIREELRDDEGRLTVNVVSPTEVSVISNILDDNEQIEYAIEADFSKVFSAFPFEKQMSQEEFIINLMTKFEETDQRLELQRLVSSIKAERVATSDDDGFSQEVATKAGVHLTSRTSVKNLWMLKTYKTFPEVDQPIIPYILRLHQRDDEAPRFALYECDGGKWKVDTTVAVREWIINRIRGEIGSVGTEADKITVL